MVDLQRKNIRVQTTIEQVDVTNYVTTVKSLVGPLELVEKALNYVSGMISDEKISLFSPKEKYKDFIPCRSRAAKMVLLSLL